MFYHPRSGRSNQVILSKRPGAKYFHNVSNKAISKALIKLATQAGIVQRGVGTAHRNEIPAAHGLRKFCITQMAKAKVDTEIAKLLTGHSIGVRGRYLDYSEDDLLRDYLKAVDLLTINEANRLRKKVDALEEKEDRIRKLERQLGETTQKLDRIFGVLGKARYGDPSALAKGRDANMDEDVAKILFEEEPSC